MYLKPIVAATAVLFATSAFAAQGVSHKTPGYQMQHSKTSTGPGASEYTPGYKMRHTKKTSTAPGASEYTPSHSITTGTSTKRY